MRPGLLAAAWLCGAVLWGGCDVSLDAFLYKRVHVDHYALKAEGDTPEETVSPDRIEPVEIHESDEVTLGAAYVHANVSPPRGYVLYFHGQCCNLNEHLGRAKRFANLGYDVLAFDYRGWGTSTDVEPDEPGILEDSKAALQWFTARTGVPRELMIYYGRSFGGATSIQLAEVEDPAVLILESPFASVEAFKTDSSGMDFPARYVSKGGWDNVARIPHVHAAVLIFHGLADDFVRPEFSRQIFAAANEPKKLVLVEGADHGNVPEKLGDAHAQLVHDWVDAHLERPP